jgi:hypothetical protein
MPSTTKSKKPTNSINSAPTSVSAPSGQETETLPVTKIPAVTVAPSSNTNATPPLATSTLTPVDLPAGSAADTPPKVTLPVVPKTFIEPSMKVFRGHYPNKLEVEAMPKAIIELGSFASYTSILGSLTTPAETFADALTLGLSWRSLRTGSEAWDTYVKAQDAKAWKEAMAMVDDVRPAFLRAVAKNAALGLAYPALMDLFTANNTVAKASSAARAKNAKTNATAAATAAKAATDAANAADAEAGKAAATVTPPKTVTVNA